MVRKLVLGWLLLVMTVGVLPVIADDPIETTAHRRTTVHAGPGHTHSPVDVLNAGITVQIVARNDIGNWVQVQRVGDDSAVLMDGWVMLGYLNIPDDLQFSQIAVDADALGYDLDNVDSRSMRRLYEVPVIPTLSDAMISTYVYGQNLGRDPQIVTKIGDSLSADDNYLTLFARDGENLGPFDYLMPTLVYYRQSTAEPSVAARIGLSSLVLFNPFWADNEVCEPNETPLECEYRVKNPSVALIMFGPNDVLSMSYEEYGENMRRATEDTLALGIIPVLSTFSYSPDNTYWWESVEFNLQLVDIAEEYDVPLINLWAASRALPDYGLDIDNTHMKQSGFNVLKYDSGHETWYGTSLRNLLALRTLHEVRTTLGLG